jgi:hypothetical protein
VTIFTPASRLDPDLALIPDKLLATADEVIE